MALVINQQMPHDGAGYHQAIITPYPADVVHWMRSPWLVSP